MEKAWLSTQIFDDEKVRFLDLILKQNRKKGRHIYEYAHVNNVITDLFMVLKSLDGTYTTDEIAEKTAYKRDASIRHNAINVSDKKVSFIEIELIN